ncbi:DUF418 domain-containing protein [Shewanella cyperi]|uniref:DUF418 domain-containing protein n=1 Tax=Shewanella cyperi TaxID=2814292 RepID=UPI001A94EC49|nr:DUF418 domain-containing protein [Shewanella cyperi]QSX40142.1 DUF418 domain-containing protein [Shewanella cyperi]
MTQTRRNPNIDAIRGLAVLGIFFINIHYMGNTLVGYVPTEPPATLDLPLEILTRMLCEGRFIGLFTLLFGVSLQLQYQSLQGRGILPVPLLRRRLGWLMLFGALHGLLLWPGDILLSYGISGMLALRYLQSDQRTLWRHSGLFLAISLLGYTLLALLPDDSGELSRNSTTFSALQQPWISNYWEQLQQHLTMEGFMLAIYPFTMLWYSSGMMLLGMALYRSGIFNHGFAHEHGYRLLALAALLGGLDLWLLFAAGPLGQSLAQISVIYAAIPVSLLYAHLLIAWCQGSVDRCRALQAVGQVALSLYLLQSVVGILLFRYLFSDWLQQFDRIEYLITALIWAGIQLWLASTWRHHFKQGPMEWLWRRLTWGANQASNEIRFNSMAGKSNAE